MRGDRKPPDATLNIVVMSTFESLLKSLLAIYRLGAAFISTLYCPVGPFAACCEVRENVSEQPYAFLGVAPDVSNLLWIR